MPLVGLLVFSAMEVRQTVADANEVRSETDLATAATGPSGIIQMIQDERNWASIELTGLEDQYEIAVAGYDETRSATDRAIQAFREEVESKGGSVREAFQPAFEGLESLEQIRRDIDAFDRPRSLDNMPFSTQLYDRYSEVVQSLIDANSRIPLQVRDATLRQGTELASVATEQVELMASISRQTTVAAMLSEGGIDTSEEISGIAMLLSAFRSNNQQILDASGPYADIVEETYPRDIAEELDQRTQDAIVRGDLGDDIDAYLEGTTPEPNGGYWRLRNAVVDELVSRADTLNDRAVARQRLFAILALGALVLAALITWLVAQSITRPLRSLTRQAKEMAERRLPEAVLDILETPLGQDVEVPHVPRIAVKTRDEVADVTEALNTVQESALDLAVEQAVLRRNIADSFVNLGRRNQNLLGRQLDFI
ncbi:MAG TPA: nitrate- and nitrite sensing domain-containing protein, partial [Acidimicrobiales bacterium]